MHKLIWKKDILAEIYTWKSALWLLLTALIYSVTCYLLLTNKELSLLDQTEMLWLLGKIIIGASLLVAIIDASSLITTEFEQETIEDLFLSPLPVRDFILGKFLTVMSVWALMYAVAVPYVLVSSAGSNLSAVFLAYAALYGTLLIAGFTVLVFGLSFLYRSFKNTLTTSLVLFLAAGIPALFAATLKTGIVASVITAINPLDAAFASLDNVLVDYHASLSANWPYLLSILGFSAAAGVFLFVSVRIFEKRGVIKE
ncbi:hypothetical protein KGQ27_03320 [Patescibacteria group bacterium]|nr:hypothetical protein [Patescibacteria group bacterium]MDE1946710.1 hypothetical protein [Patescibacteria group bacterium]MDE2010987.1 hypothetical protein [Patescibacteria group bacterium]MDE2232829.1 hypothetical protein [Patescibacteria group bacterium]